MLLVCILIGLFLRKSGLLNERAAPILNRVAITVALPALTLGQLHAMKFEGPLILAAAMPWILLALTLACIEALGAWLGWSRAIRGALVLTVGLGNTSFVGFPLLELIYGPSAIPIGIVVDQAGTFLALALVGSAIAQSYSARGPGAARPRAHQLLLRALRFPSFPAALLAFALRGVAFPAALDTLLHRLGDLLVPLALLSVGLTLRIDGSQLKLWKRELAWGLGLKLVAAPAFFAAVYGGAVGLRGPILAVTVCEAAMAPMISSTLLAQDSDLEPPLASLMLTLGIPLSFLTVPTWAALLDLVNR